MRKLFFAGAGALLLGACGEPPPPPPSADNPLLWEVANADGEVEGWLYGTIHALPDHVSWRTPVVNNVVMSADYLIVEVADLQDSQAIAEAFQKEARSAGHPLLADRVPSDDRETLAEIIDDTPYEPDDYRQIETWAAALILAQTIRTESKSSNGVDKALLRAFAGRKVEEFEGAERQFAIFDALAEEDQRVMLEAVLEEAGSNGIGSKAWKLWQSGDVDRLEAETRNGFLADPEVREALLVQRNRDWAGRLEVLLADEPVPLIAVGAAHLVGGDGLVALLERQGFTLTRLN